MHFLQSKIKELFGIDARSLALFRICMALVILGDLIVRMQDLRAFYSDEGVLPRFVLTDAILDTWHFSLHLFSGNFYYQVLLFVLQFIFGLALLVGYQTRLATILSWIMAVSLQTRNPLVIQGGDVVLRLLLFWSMFLPLGLRWSLDRKWGRQEQYDSQVFSMGTLALLLQVCFIYWFSAILKTSDIWRVDGTAVWYALSFEQSSTPLGTWLLDYPGLLKFLTFATLYLEAFGPLFAFSPIFTGPLRFATVVAFISFHLLGLNLTMELALFPYICAAAWLVFLPRWFWDKVIPSETGPTWRASLLSNAVTTLILLVIFFWNVSTTGIKVPLSPVVTRAGTMIGLDQFWTMFAPFPINQDGWYVVAATLKDGTEVDLFADGKPLSWDRPKPIANTYKNDRWRTYLMTFLEPDGDDQMPYYVEYLCREWNQTHSGDKQLDFITIFFMEEIIELGKPRKAEPVILWEHTCE